MLSYQHAYHAGNHADLLKHLTLMLVIKRLCDKDKAFSYLDTHSGAGLYQLDSEEAIKTGEAEQGIGRLSNKTHIDNAAIQDYLSLLSPFLAKQQYPGSPMIAHQLLREQDKMQLIELHNNEIDELRRNLSNQASIHHRNGFEALPALTPPNPTRGMVLIDPAYEVISDYQDVVQSVEKSLKKWATGIYLIWYPLLSQRPDKQTSNNKIGKSQAMLQALEGLTVGNLLQAEFIQDDKALGGMYGSGMAIINAPWRLDEELKSALAELTTIYAAYGNSGFSVNWLKEPA